MDKSKDLNQRSQENGFTHQFGFFGHGWGHCVVCHFSVDVQYPEEYEKKCPGPRPKRLLFPGLSYDCCSQLTDEDWKKIDAMEDKFIKSFMDEMGIPESNPRTSASSNDTSRKDRDAPHQCGREIKKQKKRFPWLAIFLGLIVLGAIVAGSIYWNHDPLTFPGQFGY